MKLHKNNGIEFEIGEKFYSMKYGRTAECVESDNTCLGCMFGKSVSCFGVRCASGERTDNKDVIFVKVKEGGRK